MEENMANVVSIAISEKEEEKIISAFAKDKVANQNQYISFFAKKNGSTISIYKPNKKGKIIAVFQGINSRKIAEAYTHFEKEMPLFENADGHIEAAIVNKFPQIGSDEVGTGDFFGPVCVCASFIKESDLPLLKKLGIDDSKKMNDEYILSIGPKLVHDFEYSQLSLPNEKFNLIHNKINMNAIKAKMHNRCLLNLYQKHPDAEVYQDQFAEPKLYFSYLKSEDIVLKNINFHTKGESLFSSVALASVIARYSFLRKMAALDEKYSLHFPLGAGQDVDLFIPYFIDKYGKDELKKVAKLSWANYKKISD